MFRSTFFDTTVMEIDCVSKFEAVMWKRNIKNIGINSCIWVCTEVHFFTSDFSWSLYCAYSLQETALAVSTYDTMLVNVIYGLVSMIQAVFPNVRNKKLLCFCNLPETGDI